MIYTCCHNCTYYTIRIINFITFCKITVSRLFSFFNRMSTKAIRQPFAGSPISNNRPDTMQKGIQKRMPFRVHFRRKRYSAEVRTLPSLMRLAITSSAMDFGTASYCLKIIENVPRPCVTVRMAFE